MLRIEDIKNFITKEDKEIIDYIENIRKKYLNSDEDIEFLDFGARSPNLQLKEEEMYNGTKVKKNIKDICRQGIKDNWAQFIYFWVKLNKPKIILELGTCCGFSAIYMAKASPSSIIYTIEGALEIATIAKKNFEETSCKNIKLIIGRFQDILKPLLDDLKSVDFAFIDGHHDEFATINYFNIIFKKVSKNGIIVLDDINWSEGMKRAWRKITKKEKIKFYDFKKIGVIIK